MLSLIFIKRPRDGDTCYPANIFEFTNTRFFEIFGEIEYATDAIFYSCHYLVNIFTRLNIKIYASNIPFRGRTHFFNPTHTLQGSFNWQYNAFFNLDGSGTWVNCGNLNTVSLCPWKHIFTNGKGGNSPCHYNK